MNYKYKGYNRLLITDGEELPNCRLYNRWARKILRNQIIGI